MTTVEEVVCRFDAIVEARASTKIDAPNLSMFVGEKPVVKDAS